ncbi:MAG: PAS domain S-box protein [Chitinophagaceae bacterium]|nr:PAS domain S-box protein [Chitinophagaceae bacterium]
MKPHLSQDKGDILQLFIENSPAAIAMLDTDLRYLLVSKRWMQDYELGDQNIIGRSHYEIFPEIPERWKKIHQQCLAGTSQRNDEDSFVRKDGQITWLKWEMHPWRKENGEIGGVIMLTEVITKMKEAELKFRNLVEQTGVGVHILQNNKLVYVNPRYAQMFGYEANELIGKMNIEQLILPEDFPIFIHNRSLRENGEKLDVKYEIRGLRKDGGIIWIEAHGLTTLYNGSTALIGTYLDITERKNVELELIRKNAEIKERVKELAGLYRISEIANNPEKNIDDIFNECLKVIPPSYQYPEITCVRLFFHGKEFTSAGFTETSWKQEKIIVSNNEPAGKIEVFYREERPVEQEGPFLKEERLLINSIADILGNSLERKKAEKEVLKFNRLYQFISEINSCMLKARTAEELYKDACRIAIEKGLFRMAWIGIYKEDLEKVIPFCWYGHEEGYLTNLQIKGTDKLAAGRGPTGRAIRTGQYQYCNDINNDPSMKPWREEALKRNYHSSISIPVNINNKLTSLYTLYMSEAFFFNDTEIKLLLEVAHNLAFALDKIRLKQLREEAENQLKESEDKFRGLVEQTIAGVYILQDGKFSYINPGLEKITGYTLEELNQMDITGQIIDMRREGVITEKKWNEYSSVDTNLFSFRFIRKDGATIYLELRNSMIHYGGKFATIGTVLDITDRMEEEKHIEKAVTDAQERERREIGMEMHDNVQQLLVGSLLTIDYAQTCLEDKELIGSIHTKLEGYIREAISELRRLSHQLAPSIGSESDFKEKVIDMISSMKLHSRIHVSVDIPHFRKKIKEDVQLSLYRILQEQFSNILKYAKAKNVWIRVEKKEDKISMVIRDDGVGFKISSKKSGIGLENIRRRANVLDGSVKIISSPGNGCEVFVEIPLSS